MYIRNDENNQPVSPQPGLTTVTVFDGCEGWSPIAYEDWNTDYVRHDENNQPVTSISSYQRHDENNQPVISISSYQRHDENNQLVISISSYQRYDENNQPVNICPQIGSDDPANAAEPDATAWVLMDGPLYNTPGDASSGFVGGQSWRKMAPIAYLPYGRETYNYGDEYVRWNGAYWAYGNNTLGDFTISFDDVVYPWLATWSNNFTGAKITSAYVKTTNYPAIP